MIRTGHRAGPARPAGRRLGLILLAAGTLCAAAEDRVVYIDRMAVDTLMDPPSDGPGFYETRMRPLAVRPGSLPYNPIRSSRQPPTRSEQDAARAREMIERAMRMVSENQPAQALIELRDALALEPENPLALHRAAQVAIWVRDYARAESYASRYLRLHPGDRALWSVHAAVLLRLSRLDAARASLDRAFELDPNFLPARFQETLLDMIREVPPRDEAFWRRQRLDDLASIANGLVNDREDLLRLIGEEDYARLCDLTLGEGAGGRLAEIRDLMVRILSPEEGMEAADRLLLLDSLMALGVRGYGSMILRAIWLAEAGSMAEAEEAWRTLMASYGDTPDAPLNYGHYLLRRGQPARAIAPLRDARRMLSRQPPGLADFVLGCALALGGFVPEAQEILHSLADSQPEGFRFWLDSDEVYNEALRRLPTYRNILRRIGVPPESE